MNQILELPGKAFKAAIINVFQQAIINILEISEALGYLRKEIEVTKNEKFITGKYNNQKK